MMARMLTQAPLPWLPGDAEEIAPGVGIQADGDGGVAWVHGLAAFAWDGGDEAARRLAAVQLGRLGAAAQRQVAAAFGTDPVTVWRWDRALREGGVAGLVPARKGPKGPSKLSPELAARIRELDAAGRRLAGIASECGVSTFTVRSALGRVPARGTGSPSAAGPAVPPGQAAAEEAPAAAEAEALPVLPDPVPRDGERALARFGLLGRGRRAGVHAGRAVPAGRAAARAAAAGAVRAAGLRPAGIRAAAGRVLRPGGDAGRAGVHGAAARGPRRGRHPDPAGRAGPGAGPGPGPGSQDDPPQARRAVRRRQGRGAAARAGPPPCRGPPGHPGIPLHRRAHPGVLRQAGHPEDAREQAEVPRPGN